jgi:hypothetical protein
MAGGLNVAEWCDYWLNEQRYWEGDGLNVGDALEDLQSAAKLIRKLLPPAPASEHKSSAIGQPAVQIGDGRATDWRHKSATEDRFDSDKLSTAAVGDESVMGARRFLDQGASEVIVNDPYNHRGRGGAWAPGVGPCVCDVCKQERQATESAARAFAEQAAQENRT